MFKLYFFASILLITFVSCSDISSGNHAASSIQQLKDMPRASVENKQAIWKTFRDYLSKKYQADTVLVYYDTTALMIGSLNEDDDWDFGMQYSDNTNQDCLQCWEIWHAFFVGENGTYTLIQEMKVGEGAGGNGQYISIDSFSHGQVYRSMTEVESGGEGGVKPMPSLILNEGKLIEKKEGGEKATQEL